MRKKSKCLINRPFTTPCSTKMGYLSSKSRIFKLQFSFFYHKASFLRSNLRNIDFRYHGRKCQDLRHEFVIHDLPRKFIFIIFLYRPSLGEMVNTPCSTTPLRTPSPTATKKRMPTNLPWKSMPFSSENKLISFLQFTKVEQINMKPT